MANMIKDGRFLMTESQYSTGLARKSRQSIKFILDDAAAACAAMPEGKNAYFYATEVRLCKAELAKRDMDERLQEEYMEQMMLHGGEC